VLEIKVIDRGSVVVDDNKLVDAAELADQRWTEVRLDLTDKVFRTHRLALCRLGFCDSRSKTPQIRDAPTTSCNF